MRARVFAAAASGVLTLGAVPGRAEEPPLTFEAVLELAVARNLDLKAALGGRAVRASEVRAAGEHPNPDLVLESTKDTPHQTIGLDIPFEPWKRSRRIDLARAQLSLADVEERTARQALRRRVRMAFFGLLGAEEGVSLAEGMVGVAARVHDVARTRFEEGAAPRLEVMQAELGLARARAELELAKSERLSARAELNALLDRPPGRSLAVAGDPGNGPAIPTSEEAAARAAAGNADLLTAEREVAIEDRRLGLLKAERIPTPVFSLGAVLNAPGEFDAGYRAGLSLALPLFARNQGEIAGSRARSDQARTHRDALRRTVEAKAFGAQAKAEAQRAQVVTYRETLVPTATSIESLAEEAYRLGRSPVLAVLDAQRSLRDVKTEYVASLMAFQSALADLEDVLGGPIE